MSVSDWKQKNKSELRQWLVETLKQQTLQVTFTKRDGTERLMKCTLKADVVVPYETKTDRKKQLNEDNVSVWDVEANAWRSFKIDCIKQIEL